MEPIANVNIVQATARDTTTVSSILREAAAWAASCGMPLWRDDELGPDHLGADVRAGMYWLAYAGEIAAGCIRFQLEDPIIWFDVAVNDSAFVHRLAVRRKFARAGISGALLDWAKRHARDLGLIYLRLDCEASRSGLRRLYARNGFDEHSETQVGPHRIVRYQCALPKHKS